MLSSMAVGLGDPVVEMEHTHAPREGEHLTGVYGGSEVRARLVNE